MIRRPLVLIVLTLVMLAILTLVEDDAQAASLRTEREAGQCTACAKQPTGEGVDLYAAPTSPVTEPDWELLLRGRAAEADRMGLIRKAQFASRQTLERHARVPVDLELPRAAVTRTREVVVMDEEAARRLSHAVRKVLEGFERAYVFFDADDPLQRAYVLTLPGIGTTVRPVAAAGNVVKASQAMRLRLFADQGGTLKRRFSLAAVPSLVRIRWTGDWVRALVTETNLSGLEDTSEPVPEAP